MLKNAATTEKGKFFFLQFPLIHERLTSVFVKKNVFSFTNACL